MAVGITQPGGAGTTIMFQTDSSAPNGLYYRALDFAAAFPANFIDLGTTPKSYRCTVDLQNGDGALSDTTTWKETTSTVYFDVGKTYIVHVTGQINRFAEFGILATGADGSPLGYNGINAYFGITPKLSSGLAQWGGNMKFYGCYLANNHATPGSSRMNFAPSVGGVSDMVDTTVFTLGGFQGYGNTSGSQIDRMIRVNSASLATGGINGHIIQFTCADAEDINLFWPNGDYKISTGGYIVIEDANFIGPSTLADTRGTLAMILKDPSWSQSVPKWGIANFLEEWISFGVIASDSNGVPLPGVHVEIWDAFDGRFVVDTVTDSQGQTDFLPLQSVAESPPFISGHEIAPFRNCLMVRGHQNDGISHEHDPFTIYLNRGTDTQVVQKFTFPYQLFLAGAEKQYSPLYLNLQIPSPGSGIATNWVEFAL